MEKREIKCTKTMATTLVSIQLCIMVDTNLFPLKEEKIFSVYSYECV